VIERALRTVAIVLSLVVAAGFCMFALDEFDRASSGQRERLAGFEQSTPTAVGELQREKRHSTGREYIDDANDVLLKPFAGVATSGNRWVQRGVPTILALLMYGFLLGYVARFAHGRGSSIAPRPRSRVAAGRG
jgi:uncharacterized membrane protein (DUF485 family)